LKPATAGQSRARGFYNRGDAEQSAQLGHGKREHQSSTNLSPRSDELMWRGCLPVRRLAGASEQQTSLDHEVVQTLEIGAVQALLIQTSTAMAVII
jgi:hypothetical protein